MMDYFKDRPTFINGAYWGCKGATRDSADIVLVAPNNDIIELQRDIDVGETRKFKTGHSVRVTNVLLSGRSTYADVVVTGIVTPPAPVIPGIPEPPAPGEICTEAYNTELVVKIPNKDGGFKSYTYNVYVPPVCTPTVPEPPAPPVPPIPPVCTEGDLAGEITCWDGSKIHTLVCKNNVFVPTGTICPPMVQAKTVKILTTGYNLPNAYVGTTVEIIAAVMCGLDKSDGEYALLTLDGTPIAESRTGSSTLGPGFVSFKWTVTGESGPRKLCVRVPKSDVCPNYSEAVDCKIMMVSSAPPSIQEQLKIERGELRERLELIRREREFVETLQKGDVDFPSFAILPTITIPETEVDIEKVIEEWEEHVGDTGTIRIPSIPIPEQLNLLPTVSIDNNIIGYPPININVVPGKHTIKVELKGLAPIYKTVTVEPDKVLTITDLSFI
jgi:hypothetical protein